MPSIVNAGKYQFSRQIQLGCVPHNAAQIQFARHNSNWIIGGPCGHLDHHICAEYVRWEEHPKDVVDQQAGQKQRRHLQTGQAHKRNKGHTQAHSHGCKRKLKVINQVKEEIM